MSRYEQFYDANFPAKGKCLLNDAKNECLWIEAWTKIQLLESLLYPPGPAPSAP